MEGRTKGQQMHDKPPQPISQPLSDSRSTDASDVAAVDAKTTNGVSYAVEINGSGASQTSQPSRNCTVLRSVGDLMRQRRKFACVYADPPWLIGEGNELFVKAFSQLPIPSLVEGAAHLHLWASNDSLIAAIQVMENWGFRFSGCLVCLNSDGRAGRYWLDSHDYLLLGTRGDLPLMESSLPSWIHCDREPNGCPSPRIRDLIERASPGPYLELFGRYPAMGWTTVGGLIGD
ncbi:MAG: MT-A70 family methyltransferase [Pirellulaceae bacterium]|nr:MT-A70 family methyltransferase [Pirellulaceae bacterium]